MIGAPLRELVRGSSVSSWGLGCLNPLLIRTYLSIPVCPSLPPPLPPPPFFLCFYTYLLSAYYVPSTDLDTETTAANTALKGLAPTALSGCGLSTRRQGL